MARRLGYLAAIALILLAAGAAHAQTLVVGLDFEPPSIDPHLRMLTPDEAISRNFFDALILQDESQRLRPGLALSWRALDDRTWRFELRHGVKFCDGSDFTAEDVAFSLMRPRSVPNATGGYQLFTRDIVAVETPDPYTAVIRTGSPQPTLPNRLSVIWIVSRRAAGADSAAFDSGKAMIGTGPYCFVEWRRGERIVMRRNEAYWGKTPAAARAELRFIPSDAARVAALAAHDVDMINSVPASVLADLERRPDIRVVHTPSARPTYLTFDTYRDVSPFVTDRAGRPLDKNPFKDLRVRKAISQAIDRKALVAGVLAGAGAPAGQMLPAGYFGTSPELGPPPFDPAAAGRLLAEAGYPGGFGVTLHVSSTRTPFDEKAAVAVAEMLSRVGIATKVESLPEAVYKTRTTKYELSFMLLGYYSETAEPSPWLTALIATPDPATGAGYANFGRHSLPEFDKLLQRAVATIDDGEREKLLRQATELAIGEEQIVPLFHSDAVWAMRDGIDYVPRKDNYTLVQFVIPRG